MKIFYVSKAALFKKKDNDDSDDSDDEKSVLSEISNESAYFESKLIYQRRALFRKNAVL